MNISSINGTSAFQLRTASVIFFSESVPTMETRYPEKIITDGSFSKKLCKAPPKKSTRK